MNRLEAIKSLRAGNGLSITFTPAQHGVSSDFLTIIRLENQCDLNERFWKNHAAYGPLHMGFISGSVFTWIHITPKQLLGFIRRNYPKH
jgi:hypothetical protein